MAKHITKLNLLRAFSSVIHKTQLNYSSKSDALSSIKILDLSRIIAGPFCTMVLGDLGAEIIKVEKPGTGDESRKWGPPFINNSNESCYFLSTNRNKKSIGVDFKSEKGRNIIYELAKICDVLVENYVPGTLDKLKLGYDDLKAIAPHLIYCSVTGYGSEGPYRNKPGYDVIAASVGGLHNITGPVDGPPVRVGVAITDITTGLYAHGAILAALLQKTKTGLGQKIDCNLLSTQIASLINISSNYLNSGIEGERLGSAHQSIVPYQIFKVKDGYLTLGTGSDNQFKDLCIKIGREDLSANIKYQTNALRVQNRKELIEILEDILQAKTKKEWMNIFGDTSFPYGPVNNLGEVFSDPHVTEIDLVKTVEHPKLGKIKLVGPPVKYEKIVNEVRYPPPLLGEHTDEILSKYLGYSNSQIESLTTDGVIQCNK